MAGPRRAPNSGSPLPDGVTGGADPSARTPRGTAKDRALRLLGVRARSREELRRRLVAAGFPPDDVEAAVQDLQAVGLVDDERFAVEFARDRATRRLEGDRLVRSSLLAKGLPTDLTDRTVAALGDQGARAADLAARKARRMTGLDPAVAHRRLVGMLIRRGYAPDAARDAARAALSAAQDPCDQGASAVD